MWAPAAALFVILVVFLATCRSTFGGGGPAVSNYNFKGFNLQRLYFLVVLGMVFCGMWLAAPGASLVGGYRCKALRFCAAPWPMPPWLPVRFPAMLGLIFE